MSSEKHMLTNAQENVLHFLNTHLAMVALLMPWKKVVTVVDATKEENVELFTLLDFSHFPDSVWWVGMNGAAKVYDTSLIDKTHILIGVTASVLFFSILGFLGSVMYPRDTSARFGIDTISLIMGIVTLVLAITFQTDFDAVWVQAKKFQAGNGLTVDPDQMFLVIGVLVGQIVVSLALMGDKIKEVTSKLVK